MKELEKIINYLIKEKGGTKEQYLDLLKKIGYHESAHTMDPTIKQIGGGPGRGIYQFEEGQNAGGITAARRTKQYLDSVGASIPKWLKEATSSDSLDATKLSTEQQGILFLGNMRKHPKADLGKVVNGEESIEDFWANYHWAGDPLDRKNRINSFKESISTLPEKKTYTEPLPPARITPPEGHITNPTREYINPLSIPKQYKTVNKPIEGPSQMNLDPIRANIGSFEGLIKQINQKAYGGTSNTYYEGGYINSIDPDPTDPKKPLNKSDIKNIQRSTGIMFNNEGVNQLFERNNKFVKPNYADDLNLGKYKGLDYFDITKDSTGYILNPTKKNIRGPEAHRDTLLELQKLNPNIIINQRAYTPMSNRMAYGGTSDNNQYKYGGLNSFNVGGLHSQNPYGGIPQGIGNNGKMNTVEEGETSIHIKDIGKFIFSNRINIDGSGFSNNTQGFANGGSTECGGPGQPPCRKRKDERYQNIKSQDNTYVNNDAKSFIVAPGRNKTPEEIATERVTIREASDNNILNTVEGLGKLMLPGGSNMMTRENMAEASAGLESQFRVSDKPNLFDDYINPLNMIGGMAANLGQAPLASKQSNSNLPYVTAIGAPLTVGALGGVGAKTTGQFTNNILNPVAGIKDMVGKHYDYNNSVIGKGIEKLENLYEKYIYQPRNKEAIRKLNNYAREQVNFFKTQDGKQRLANMGITGDRYINFMDNLYDLSLTSTSKSSSHFSPPTSGSNINKINVNMNDLKYIMKGSTPEEIFDHEMGHFIQNENNKGYIYPNKKNIYDLIDDLSSDKLTIDFSKGKGYSTRTTSPTWVDMELGKLELKHGSEPISKIDRLLSNSKSNSDYFNRASGNYGTDIDNSVERYPFLREYRQAMYQSGILKNKYDDVTPEMIDKFYKLKPKNRINNIMKLTPKNKEILINALKYSAVAGTPISINNLNNGK